MLTVHSSPIPAQLILTPQHCKWKHQQQKFLHLSICNIYLPPNTFFFLPEAGEIVFVFLKKQFSFNTPHTHTHTMNAAEH